MNNQTLLNCPGCFREELSLLNITLASNDKYKLSYYCNSTNKSDSIGIDQYLSSIVKEKYCDVHPYTRAVYCLEKNAVFCKECFVSRITSERSNSHSILNQTRYCLIHKRKKIKNHCDKCNVDVCKMCIRESHIDHCEWVYTTKSDLNLKNAFRKEFSVLFQDINSRIKQIDKTINQLETIRKNIIQTYNNYQNVNLPILNLYELLFNDNQIRPHNSLVNAIKSFSVDLLTQSFKIISKLKGEVDIISNSTEVINKTMRYLFQLSPFSFKPIKYNGSSIGNSGSEIGSSPSLTVSSSANKRINLTSCNIKPFNKVAITLREHIGTIYSLIQLTNGNFASSSADGTIKFWDSYSFKLINSILAHTESVNLITEVKENIIASCSNDNTIKLWNLTDDLIKVTTIKEHSPIISIEPLNNNLIASFFDNMIDVWNINTQQLVYSRSMPNSNYIKKIINNTFASSMDDYSIMIYDLFDKNQSFVLQGHSDAVSSLIPFKKEYIASGSFDRTIRVWNLNTRKNCIVFNEAHLYSINCLVELNDGRLASGSNDKVISVWDLDAKQCNVKLIGHEGAVRSLIQLSNGKLVSGSSDETIRIWE